MAAGSMTFYDIFAESLGDGTIDLDNDTIKVALFTSSYTPNDASDVTFSALANEITDTGYTAGGDEITTKSWSQTGGVATFSGDSVSWTAGAGGISAYHAVIYSVTGATNNLIAHFLLDSTPQAVSVTEGNDLTINWNGSGIFTVTV